MTPEKTSLFIGRFQPFHLGHLDAIRQIREEGKTDLLLIGIGSAEDDYTPANPFTAGERFAMIYDSLIEAKIPADSFQICPLRNIEHYALWPKHIALLLPPFTRVYSGSPLVRQLFSTMPHVETIALRDQTGISATGVRLALKADEPLSGLIPDAALAYLRQIQAQRRLLDIESTTFRT